MKTILLILTIILALGTGSCEQNVSDANLVYVEELVIRAQITGGDTISNVQITRTLPPLDQYSPDKAEVNDADAKIISDGREYRLRNIGHSIYTSDSLVPQVGRSYELQVRWKGKYAWATTTIPQPPVIEKVYGTIKKQRFRYGADSVISIQARMKPLPDASYLGFDLIYFVNNGILTPSKAYVQNIYRISDTTSDGMINVPMVEFSIEGNADWKQYFNFNYSDHNFGVEAFDKDFYDYYTTRWDSHQSSNPFGSSGVNTRWNIKGDGVGMFIGTSLTKIKVKL